MKRTALLSAAAFTLACSPELSDHPELYLARGDLAEIRGRGVLRVLVPTLGERSLTRSGSPEAEDREMALAFAQKLGLRCEFVAVGSRSGILDLLEEGYGDLVTAQLTVTGERARRHRFTHPTAIVDEWLVGRRGEPNLPRTVAALDGREIHLRRSSSFAETLSELARTHRLNLRLTYVEEDLDTESIAYQVSRGVRSLTVVDSNLLASIESYNRDLERLLILAEGRELAWVVRREAVELGAALDAFLIERHLTSHRTDDLTTEGLSAVEERGSLRLITSNDPVRYFLYRGRQMGFDYEIGRLAAERLGVRLEMVVPPRRELLLPWLLEGRGDVIASALTRYGEGEERVAMSRPFLFVEDLVIQSATAEPPITRPEELAGKTAFLQGAGARAALGSVPVELLPEEMAVEEILDRVAAGDYPVAVVESHLLVPELSHRSDVRVAFALPAASEQGRPVGFAVRAENPRLLAAMDGIVSELVGSLELNDARERYFRNHRGLLRVKERRAAISGRLSPYDDLLKKYSHRYGLDWRLMAAQAYQESRFDPDAESWAGAIGLFQLLPSTGLELGFENLRDPETGVHAGIRYMHLLFERIEARVPLKHRLRFALAAYNAGFGHLQDARRLAEEEGLDPDKWFGHTERAMLLLSQPSHYRKSRHGYVRGGETVTYVSEIQNRYDHYVTLIPF